jgi:hypothetical protein
MADVNVTVMVDGKAAFVAGAVGAPDGNAHVVGALQYALRHFQDVLASRVPVRTSLQGGVKPQDTSL